MVQNDFNGEDATGEHVTNLLHVTKSLSALGDVLSSLTSKKEMIPYENSRLTRLLEDSIGGSSKTLLIVNVCPNASSLPKTLSALTFSARARSAELSLGNRDTIKKCRDVGNSTLSSLYHFCCS
ncbi:kinesin-like protein KIN-14B [Papaver somniferum]|uniref:kinesin-like protein KIN-14B n=1 Tax=Papaver somniferum TaxID=3469 RepID=UPI000E700EE5|nr:kinesin-like protein KIN-14B [Papaver somniferum]